MKLKNILLILAIYIALDGLISLLYFSNKTDVTALQQITRLLRMIIGVFIAILVKKI